MFKRVLAHWRPWGYSSYVQQFYWIAYHAWHCWLSKKRYEVTIQTGSERTLTLSCYCFYRTEERGLLCCDCFVCKTSVYFSLQLRSYGILKISVSLSNCHDYYRFPSCPIQPVVGGWPSLSDTSLTWFKFDMIQIGSIRFPHSLRSTTSMTYRG